MSLTREPEPPPPPTDADVTPEGNGQRPVSEVERLRAKVLHGEEIRKVPPLTPLVEGWLDLDTLAVLYGRPASGKSLLALDLGLHVATGSWWYGHEVTDPRDVLYVVAEGAAGTAKRLDAWKLAHRHYGEIERIHWLTQPVKLLDPVAGAALAVVAAEIEAGLVVIDTLNRSMSGGDENSSRDMGLAIAAADNVRAATGGTILIVHHSGKDTSAGSRGHSSLLGAVSTELELKNSDGILNLASTKQKDRAEAPPQRLAIIPVPEADSVAIGRPSQRTDVTETLTEKTTAVLDTLTSIDDGGGITAAVWERTVSDLHGIGASGFHLQRKRLVDLGLVTKDREGRGARYSPVTRENA